MLEFCVNVINIKTLQSLLLQNVYRVCYRFTFSNFYPRQIKSESEIHHLSEVAAEFIYNSLNIMSEAAEHRLLGFSFLH